MTNIERARRLVLQVREVGTNDFCACAGSRNSPLLAVLSSRHAERSEASPSTRSFASLRMTDNLSVFSFVDERSAAFFALGRTKLHGQPAAVVTTSGTAVAELMPAVVEAHYSASPLILITADRPARFRGSGAPQTIEQIAIFGAYAATSLDGWKRNTPLHLNIEFDEPLIDE